MGLIKKRILIAEDHAILREGLRALLSPESDWEIAGEARDGREAIDGVTKLKPDIVILDLSMPRVNGLDETVRQGVSEDLLGDKNPGPDGP